jgi:hypothetical protein
MIAQLDQILELVRNKLSPVAHVPSRPFPIPHVRSNCFAERRCHRSDQLIDPLYVHLAARALAAAAVARHDAIYG